MIVLSPTAFLRAISLFKLNKPSPPTFAKGLQMRYFPAFGAS
jgi:hypothetical protein